MRKTLSAIFLSVIGVAAIDATLAGYFLYAPSAEVPKLSGTVEHGRIVAGGLKRTYLLYVPRGLTKGAPLIVAMHGSGENGSRMRIQTGYGFDRLADKYGFAVVYPDGYEGYWNGCNIVGDYSANTLSIDDVGFLTHLVDKLAGDIGVDRSKVFAMGISRGGSMALRLALETPSAFRAVASVSDSVPAPANFKCKPVGHGTSSVMIMNGTSDPIVPFDGGEVSLFGLFIKRGPVLSSRASAQYFADLNHLGGELQTSETQKADGVLFERVLWHSDSGMDVELVAIHGGGHGMPQPYQRHMRLLGPSPMAPNGPELIWNFFTKTAGDRRP